MKYCFKYILFPLLVRFLVNLLVDVPKLIKVYLVVNEWYFIYFWLLLVCTVPLVCDQPSFEFALYSYPSLTNQRVSFWLTDA